MGSFLLPAILHQEPRVDLSFYACPSIGLCSTEDTYGHVPSPPTAFPALGFLLFPLDATVLAGNLSVPRACDFRCQQANYHVPQSLIPGTKSTLQFLTHQPISADFTPSGDLPFSEIHLFPMPTTTHKHQIHSQQ